MMVQAAGTRMLGYKLAMQQWKNWHSGLGTVQPWHEDPTYTHPSKQHTV